MNTEQIGLTLRRRRNFLGITQEDLAEISGISERTLRNIEKGQANPELDTLIKICEVLGLEIIIDVMR